MASKIKDFINRAKKSMGSRKPPVADARTMHAQRNNGTTGLNTVPNETFAQTEYRAAKINAARDAYSARKAAKAAKSSQQSAAASSTRAPAPSVRAERPDRNPAHHSPEGLTLRYEGSDYGDGNTSLPPGVQRAGELTDSSRSKSKPKNYPRTTPEEGGGLAPPAAKRKTPSPRGPRDTPPKRTSPTTLKGTVDGVMGRLQLGRRATDSEVSRSGPKPKSVAPGHTPSGKNKTAIGKSTGKKVTKPTSRPKAKPLGKSTGKVATKPTSRPVAAKPKNERTALQKSFADTFERGKYGPATRASKKTQEPVKDKPTGKKVTKPTPRPTAKVTKPTSRPKAKAKAQNPRSRITSGKSNSTQSAVRDLTKRRKNKVKGQR